MIGVIMPSRGRPKKWLETFKKWDTNSPYNEAYVLSLDQDDTTLDQYLNISPDHFSLLNTSNNTKIIVNKNRSAVDAINRAAEQLRYCDILIVVSDDSEPNGYNWTDKIHQITQGKRDWILKVQDGIQPWIITQPIMHRDYYNRFGYIYHPEYLHMFCDTELTCVADITGRKITSNLLFPHKHYSVTKEAPDAVNRKADSTWAQGEKLFLDRYKKNFDLPKGFPINDQGMIKWLQNKAR